MKIRNFFIGGAMALVGLFMILVPQIMMAVFISAMGLLTVLNGVSILKLLKNKENSPSINKVILVRGILSLIMGLFAAIYPVSVEQVIWNLICFSFGSFLVVSIILETVCLVQLSKENKNIKSFVVESAISFVVAILLFIIAATAGLNLIIRIAGFVIAAAGIIIIVVTKNTIVVNPDSVETVEAEISDSPDDSAKESTDDSE